MEEKIRYSASDIAISRITESDKEALSAFFCGVETIDRFIHDEALLCAKYLYLIPYKCTFRDSGEILGVFTLANDVLTLEYEDKSDFPNISPEYSDIFLRQTSYPAINIGHLAVCEEEQSKGIGRLIVNFIAASFSRLRMSGCQFITVDALNNRRTKNFYENRLGFEFQTVLDMGKETRRMYLDIFTSPAE